MNERAAQGVGAGSGIVIEEVDEFATRGADGGVALDGGLLAASDDDLQTVLRVIQRARSGDSGDVLLSRSRRDDDGHEWKRVAHGAKLGFRLPGSKFKFFHDHGREKSFGHNTVSPLD